MVAVLMFLSIVADAAPPPPERSAIARVRVNARIVSGGSTLASQRRVVLRRAVDPSNGRPLVLAEYE